MYFIIKSWAALTDERNAQQAKINIYESTHVSDACKCVINYKYTVNSLTCYLYSCSVVFENILFGCAPLIEEVQQITLRSECYQNIIE